MKRQREIKNTIVYIIILSTIYGNIRCMCHAKNKYKILICIVYSYYIYYDDIFIDLIIF